METGDEGIGSTSQSTPIMSRAPDSPVQGMNVAASWQVRGEGMISWVSGAKHGVTNSAGASTGKSVNIGMGTSVNTGMEGGAQLYLCFITRDITMGFSPYFLGRCSLS